MKKPILCLLFILLVVPLASAKQGHITLLAVKESREGYEGAIADLYLEIKPGSGRVFLDTFPLTKVDTQISTRFAKEIACSYLDDGCSKYDFVYTIRADSPIIAGPSAGSAITLLTIAMLDGFELDETIGITGTINSGGIIGPVGGIKEKIDAAKQAGLRKVLIPEGERFVIEDRKVIETITVTRGDNITIKNASINNKTVDLVEYGKEKGLEVVEVSDIGRALSEFKGKQFKDDVFDVTVNEEYEKTMSSLASQLCNRSYKLIEEVNRVYSGGYNVTMSDISNLTARAKIAVGNNRYYSAASYCFGANVKLTQLLLVLNNATDKDVKNNIEIIDRNIKKLEKSIDEKEKKTITDLEAYAVVKERLIEAQDYKKDLPEKNITKEDLYNLAYAFERVYSAFSWTNFFDHRGNEYNFDKNTLKSSCNDKIAEAEERYNYALLFYPGLDLSGTRDEIDNAYDDLNNGYYELCLFKATQAKAESDVILSVSGVGGNMVDGLLNKKLEVAKKNIAKQTNKGNFPILAYSYYEYGDELREADKFSALLYAEYALELSNLDMYFEKERKDITISDDIIKPIVYIAVGIVIGYLISKFPKKKIRRKR